MPNVGMTKTLVLFSMGTAGAGRGGGVRYRARLTTKTNAIACRRTLMS
jgi:hypothetical protein